MASRLLIAALIGTAAAIALTRLIISYDYIRIWLINVPSLLVWGGAFLAGIIVAVVSPPEWELRASAGTMLLGSLAGIIAFGTGMNVSLADEATLTYILLTLLVSGLCLLVLSGLGALLVAEVRERTDSKPIRDYGRGQPRSSRSPARNSSRRSDRSQYE